ICGAASFGRAICAHRVNDLSAFIDRYLFRYADSENSSRLQNPNADPKFVDFGDVGPVWIRNAVAQVHVSTRTRSAGGSPLRSSVTISTDPRCSFFKGAELAT